MKRFIIHGYEGQYQGHHGIENYQVVEFINEEEAMISHELELLGEQLSLDVMESFPSVMEELEAIAHERFEDPLGSDEDAEYDEILEDVKMDNIDYAVYQLNSDFDKYSLEDLVKMDPESIVEQSIAIF